MRKLLLTLLVFGAAVGTCLAQSTPSHLLPFSYYKLEDADASQIADSANANNGTVTGGTSAPGWIGNGILLNPVGDDGHLTVGHHLSFGNMPQFSGAVRMTTSAWVKFVSTADVQPFITKWGSGGNTYWTDFSGGVPRAAFQPGEFITAADITLQADGRWHHVAWIYNGAASGNVNRLKLYVDGTLRKLDFATFQVPATLASGTAPVVVGSYDSSNALGLHATVDEIGFWNGTAGESLISNLYDFGNSFDPHDDVATAIAPVHQRTTYELIKHADQVHREATVVLAHTHDFMRDPAYNRDDFADARSGGVTGLTAKLTVDGTKWNPTTRLREPVTMFNGVNPDGSTGIPDSGWATMFECEIKKIRTLTSDPASGVVLITSADQIVDAKTNGKVGVIIGSEGANQLRGDLNKAQDYYAEGWRETQLRWADRNLLLGQQWTPEPLTDFGRRFVRKANRLGILIDVSHIYHQQQLDSILNVSTAPVIRSHDVHARWGCGELDQDDVTIRKIAQSGGGHGVIAVHAIGNNYNTDNTADQRDVCGAPGNTNFQTLEGLLRSIDSIKNVQGVGVEHVALGPDYMPEDRYESPSTPGKFFDRFWNVAVTDLSDVTLGLLRRGYTDADIKKILGENLIDLYRHVWNPPHDGPATLQICADNSADVACVAATANGGEGDMTHRPINCTSESEPGVIGTQLSNVGGSWFYCSNVDSTMRQCRNGSTLVASWVSNTGNARFKLCDASDSDATCIAATQNGGAGTTTTRAINCVNPSVKGVVGLQLVYDGGWYFNNAAMQRVQCAGKTLVADWSGSASNAHFSLCENGSTDVVCHDAATDGGNGTTQARAINCANSSGKRGQVGFQLTYLNDQGEWRYYDKTATAPPLCLEGSPLVVSWSP